MAVGIGATHFLGFVNVGFVTDVLWTTSVREEKGLGDLQCSLLFGLACRVASYDALALGILGGVCAHIG